MAGVTDASPVIEATYDGPTHEMDGFGASELATLRAATPGCARVTHLNNAGAGLVSSAVLRVQTEFLEREAAIGAYEAAREAEDEIAGTYRALATLIGCSPHEIALAPNATWAWCQAFLALRIGKGDRMLTGRSEYIANYLTMLKRARDVGATVEIVPSDEHGQLDVAALDAMIDSRVKLISIPHMPTNGGLVNPVAEIGRVAKHRSVPFLLDACQTVGQLDLSVAEIGCDMLSGTSRKFLRGPRGLGFLYVREGLIQELESPVVDPRAADWLAPDRYSLHPDARRFETWEYSIAGALGLGEAAKQAVELGLPKIEARITALAHRLRTALASIPGVSVCDAGRRKGAIVTFSLAGMDATEAMHRLIGRGFNVNITRPGFTLLDMTKRGLPDLVRASPHYYNTEEEIDGLSEAVEGLAESA